ncbi:MAG: hypothetical protein WAU36_06675 [Cyclobacteriaceae bacterium]
MREVENIKEASTWFENGKKVTSKVGDVKDKPNWKHGWVEVEGQAIRHVYFHKIHGGTFLYPN